MRALHAYTRIIGNIDFFKEMLLVLHVTNQRFRQPFESA